MQTASQDSSDAEDDPTESQRRMPTTQPTGKPSITNFDAGSALDGPAVSPKQAAATELDAIIDGAPPKVTPWRVLAVAR